jgi:hypothetical protein
MGDCDAHVDGMTGYGDFKLPVTSTNDEIPFEARNC